MVSESSLSPIPALVHLIAIAAGLYLGWIAMDAISPDLPDPGVDPALSSSTVAGAVAGDDPDSLFSAAALGPALLELEEQFAAGEGLLALRVEPGSVSAETSSADGTFSLDQVPPAAVEELIARIHAERPAVSAVDVGYLELVATADGPRWYVQLDTSITDVPPPWTYGARLEGGRLIVGGAPPTPVEPR